MDSSLQCRAVLSGRSDSWLRVRADLRGRRYVSSFGWNRGGGRSSWPTFVRRRCVRCRASGDLAGEFVVGACSGVALCPARLGQPGVLGRVGAGLDESFSKDRRPVGVGIARLVEQHVPALAALFGFGQFGVAGDESFEFGLECCSASPAERVYS